MKEKYFTPDISEIHVGYEIEWKSKIRNQDWEKTICDVDLISIIYDEFEHSDFEELFDEQFRTSYLTKEQIEAEGWEYIQEFNYSDFFFKKGQYCLLYDNCLSLKLMYSDNRCCIFEGKIKCINQFRNILKYLCINT